MRGQAVTAKSIVADYRITPADAGTSYPSKTSPFLYTDHPRGCGDKSGCDQTEFGNGGSPPRMRGQALPMLGKVIVQRITPADAGTSLFHALASLMM